MIVTATGIPLSVQIVKASVHDSSLTSRAVDEIELEIVGSRVIADKGYISEKQLESELDTHFQNNFG